LGEATTKPPPIPLDQIRLDCKAATRSKVDHVARSERLLTATRAKLHRHKLAKRLDYLP
jgi:hypothetical protein